MKPAIGAAALLCVITVAAGTAATGEAQRRPNFVSDVAPILHAKCATCHQPDGAAPFALLSIDDARAKAKEMKAAVSSKEMPPWSATAAAGYPALQHDRRLTA